ncbi:MAG: hypothetical protein SOS24_03110 [Clostridia bacterium]|nr:hypothetical protein [Clostridia bacterium]
MRKGYVFENEIKRLMSVAEACGMHWHKNNPNRTVNGIYVAGEPYDYEIFLPEGVEVFDAKEVSGRAWHLKDKDVRQCSELCKCAEAANVKAYFVLLFGGSDVRAVSAAHVKEVLTSGSRTVGKDECTEWDLPKRLKHELSKQQTSCRTA